MSWSCRKCGKTADEVTGWLERVNEKGVPGIWECRPDCEAVLNDEDAITMCIDHVEPVNPETEEGE